MMRNFLEKLADLYYMYVPCWIKYPKKSYSDYKWIKSFPPGTIIEDCSYLPAIILENNKGDLKLWSMCTSRVCGCSLFHCGITKLDPEYAFNLSEKWIKGEVDRDSILDYIEHNPNRYL